MKARLFPTSPFDFVMMLQRPVSRPSSVVLIDKTSWSYTRALRILDDVVPVTVASVAPADSPELILEIPDGLSPALQSAVRNRVQFMFSTELNLHQFHQHMALDPAWTPLLNRLRGVRPIQDADLFESMIRSIIGQQLNIKFAATLVERLVLLGGVMVEWKDQWLPVFPSPEQVANLRVEQLRELSFSQRKAEYVIGFGRAVANGDIHLEQLPSMPDEEIFDTLMPLRGIGRWTIECLLLFGLGRSDVMPAADIGVQNAVQKLYGMAERPSESAIRHLAEPWAPWRSYATYYLWQSLIHA